MVNSTICHVSHCLIFPFSVYSVHTLSSGRLCSFPVLIPLQNTAVSANGLHSLLFHYDKNSVAIESVRCLLTVDSYSHTTRT
jgi:hypothetical protein